MRLHLPRILLAASVAVAAPALVQAQTAKPRPAKKTAAFGQGKGLLLTRAELRACLDLQERVRTQNDAANREREQLDHEKSEIVQQGQTLKEQLGTLDRTNAEAVAKYNEAATDRDKRIDAFEARMGPFNEKVEALQKEREAFVRQCDNRRYDEDDEIAIRKGR
jgi:DNA repair exonuclease SbcCD ATPase subunit